MPYVEENANGHVKGDIIHTSLLGVSVAARSDGRGCDHRLDPGFGQRDLGLDQNEEGPLPEIGGAADHHRGLCDIRGYRLAC